MVLPLWIKSYSSPTIRGLVTFGCVLIVFCQSLHNCTLSNYFIAVWAIPGQGWSFNQKNINKNNTSLAWQFVEDTAPSNVSTQISGVSMVYVRCVCVGLRLISSSHSFFSYPPWRLLLKPRQRWLFSPWENLECVNSTIMTIGHQEGRDAAKTRHLLLWFPASMLFFHQSSGRCFKSHSPSRFYSLF